MPRFLDKCGGTAGTTNYGRSGAGGLAGAMNNPQWRQMAAPLGRTCSRGDVHVHDGALIIEILGDPAQPLVVRDAPLSSIALPDSPSRELNTDT